MKSVPKIYFFRNILYRECHFSFWKNYTLAACSAGKKLQSTTSVTFFVLLVALSFTCSAHAEDYIGKTIDSLAKNYSVQKLPQGELEALITDKILVGESAKTQWFGVYFIKHIYADGTFSIEVYRKGSDKLLKEITDNTWFVEPDGTWCTTRDDVKRCDKMVYKIGNTYLSVLKKNGKINASWSVKNAVPAPKEQ
ncbi:MAG: hypothetical protein JRJ37_03190 [Deltaproteobacteria bacterium]|nr:hypothetical protein [Deltaproteobacteria bacterium]